MRAGARDAQTRRLQEVGQRLAHLAQLMTGLVDVLAHGGPDLDHRLHHLPLHLFAESLLGGGQQRIDVRMELPGGVDDLVFLFDPDRQKAVATHAGPSTTNVGTTLPAPAVTFSRAAADTRVMKPPGLPS